MEEKITFIRKNLPICQFCKEEVYHGLHKRHNKGMKYLAFGNHSHYECYIDECVKRSMEKYGH